MRRRFGSENLHGGSFGGGGLNVAGGAGVGSGERTGEFGEVEDGGSAFNGEGGDVVGTRRHLRGGEGAEPDPVLLSGLPDFGYPLPPRPHSDPSVYRVLAAAVPGPFGPLLFWVGYLGLRQ